MDDDELDDLISEDSTVSSSTFPVQSAQVCKRPCDSQEM